MSTRVARTQGSPTAAPARRHARLRGAPVGVAAAVIAVATLVAIVIWGPWPGGAATGETRLAVVDHRTGNVVHERAVTVGETFELRHTHSVTRRPVTETFSVLDEDTIGLEELVFDEYGPNLPAGAEHVGQHATFETDGDTVRVRHHGKAIGTLPVVVGSEQVDHVVVFADGERLRLLDVATRGSRVEVMAATTSGGSQR